MRDIVKFNIKARAVIGNNNTEVEHINMDSLTIKEMNKLLEEGLPIKYEDYADITQLPTSVLFHLSHGKESYLLSIFLSPFTVMSVSGMVPAKFNNTVNIILDFYTNIAKQFGLLVLPLKYLDSTTKKPMLSRIYKVSELENIAVPVDKAFSDLKYNIVLEDEIAEYLESNSAQVDSEEELMAAKIPKAMIAQYNETIDLIASQKQEYSQISAKIELELVKYEPYRDIKKSIDDLNKLLLTVSDVADSDNQEIKTEILDNIIKAKLKQRQVSDDYLKVCGLWELYVNNQKKLTSIRANQLRIIELKVNYPGIGVVSGKVRTSLERERDPELLIFAKQYVMLSYAIMSYKKAKEILRYCIMEAKKHEYQVEPFVEIIKDITKKIDEHTSAIRQIEQHNDICVIVSKANTLDSTADVIKYKQIFDEFVLNVDKLQNELNRKEKTEGSFINISMPVTYCFQYKLDKRSVKMDSTASTETDVKPLAAIGAFLDGLDPRKPVNSVIDKLRGFD